MSEISARDVLADPCVSLSPDSGNETEHYIFYSGKQRCLNVSETVRLSAELIGSNSSDSDTFEQTIHQTCAASLSFGNQLTTASLINCFPVAAYVMLRLYTQNAFLPFASADPTDSEPSFAPIILHT